MSKKDKIKDQEEKVAEEVQEATKQATSEKEEVLKEEALEEKKEDCEDDKTLLEKQILELKDKHLRLFSEFDNFRKRTSKERIELFKTASQDLMIDLLPIIDDFERAIDSSKDSDDAAPIKEGVNLIYNKLKSTLERKGLKCMDSKEKDFDTDFHEAITEIPAPTKKLKSKVVDVVEKGYTLNDKVIRYAKVVVGK
ncbi:MAG: nucleotide exchange factor GrpE [Bacteroidetes bacterium 4572_77]|nr:MAG: nucleotide exchange factor GrpE [Bacteroidetes bacterium 4572_77]